MLNLPDHRFTGWKSDRFQMNMDKDTDTQAILMCEYTIHHATGDEIDNWNISKPIKSYYPLAKQLLDEEMFALLDLLLDSTPSWHTIWWNKLEGITLYPEHTKYEGVLSIADWSLRQDEILALRKHKRVMHLRMQEAWLFSISGDMFGSSLKPRYFDCNVLNDSMPGGNCRDYWALKEPTPLTKGETA